MTDVWVLTGSGTTVEVYPSALHSSVPATGGAGADVFNPTYPSLVAVLAARRLAEDPTTPTAADRRRRDEDALAVLGAI